MMEAREILGRESEVSTSRPPHTCAEVREAHDFAEAARVKNNCFELNKALTFFIPQLLGHLIKQLNNSKTETTF